MSVSIIQRFDFPFVLVAVWAWYVASFANAEEWSWQSLPPLPDAIGVAGPIVGSHRDTLIVAGGANFPLPVWQTEKQWVDRIHLLRKVGDQWRWSDGGTLPAVRAYGVNVSTSRGVLTLGGSDANQLYADIWLLTVQENQVTITTIGELPFPAAHGNAVIADDFLYWMPGQRDTTLESASAELYRTSLSDFLAGGNLGEWEVLPNCPGGARAFQLMVTQQNDETTGVYVISGRRQAGEEVVFLQDTWLYQPDNGKWIRKADAPACCMAGVAFPVAQRHIFVTSGADGSLFHQTNELQDRHPGFPKRAFRYDIRADRWSVAGETPMNQVTTSAVPFDNAVIVPSGEVRPRVRTDQVWRISIPSNSLK
ncbi:MAG: hypothetical protein KDA87_12005 [Planctomycetales bacterium]|nr:hypothetical protein [Planctomycetales bacterium]